MGHGCVHAPQSKGVAFSDGSYGVYYVADRLGTAIKETAYHFERFARDSSDPARREDMRVLVGSVSNHFHDIESLRPAKRSSILDPASYAASQAIGRALREASSNGIIYPSVRDPGGHCLAAFWPDVIGIPTQERHLQYDWDGARVGRYFDYALDRWVPLRA